MHRFASLQGLKNDAEEWEDLEHRMKDAFNARFLHIKEGTSLVPGHTLYPDSIYYGNNTVTANILPLAFGLVPKNYMLLIYWLPIKHILPGDIWLKKVLLPFGSYGTGIRQIPK